MKKGFLSVLLTVLAVFGLSACNTVEGVGKDLESAGRGIQDTF
jgi:entericidin B